MPDDNVLIVFAKAPEPGLAKTRLVPPLSPDEAAALARAFIADMLDKAAASGVTVWLACTPDGSMDMFRELAAGRAECFITQEGAGLGERMAAALDRAFEAGAKKAAIVGTDIPTMPVEVIGGLFDVLDDCDMAIGPATDGGYYIIGMKRPVPGIFGGITWSMPDVLERTLEKAASMGLIVKKLPAQVDVDTVGDLVTVMGGQLPSHTEKALEPLKDRLKPPGRSRDQARDKPRF